MSFSIYWEKLDKRVAQTVQAQLNTFFANLEPRPQFLGELSVEHLDFGSVPPYLEILDLTEPFPEFYLATEDDARQASDYSGVDDAVERPRSQSTVRSRLGPRMDVLMGSGAVTPRVWGSVPPLFQTPPRVQPGEVLVERSADDMQVAARVEYHGDMALVLRTELQLNYPASQFVSLPVTLHITKVQFSAVAVVAYLRDRVNFCFLEPDPPRTSLLDAFAIRTEVGDAGQHVLKNVEKLESFITEQLRRAIDDEFVFPSYHSFELD
ncbi:Mitochondrial distribution and morphology protein 12 [Coemansia sp. RSA 2708]|nr:Mitochondrial distribution and morphology protein 12 [Coemansia sp. RSA 2708]KAJ2314780.1 Mitochondrial distribution and morphology protein 12 [Coemansia sp. RSA 2705]KAJ2321646.1 Mitochondrial distribution and morphology protein 12 [Coemansia sp. RSA 2704]KAJ2329699.1 Mitochondrial distribution and morphology protein 12 [Coemansia sp. RSA 2702]KAJ2739404.1 Mitochondrial distribution and morphology protein 12 [Coemansia sp. Cherry 401B]